MIVCLFAYFFFEIRYLSFTYQMCTDKFKHLFEICVSYSFCDMLENLP